MVHCVAFSALSRGFGLRLLIYKRAYTLHSAIPVQKAGVKYRVHNILRLKTVDWKLQQFWDSCSLVIGYKA